MDGRDETLHAWVDESMHDEVAGISSATYLLAAGIGAPVASEPIRELMRALLPRGAAALHWRFENDALRRRVVSAIAETGIDCLVVVGVRADPHRQERARRKCMEALLVGLEQRGVSHVWLESRTSSLNRRDREMVSALRGARAITPQLRVDFQLSSADPMLWIPDAVAGAVGMARKGGKTEFRRVLDDTVHEVMIDIRRGIGS